MSLFITIFGPDGSGKSTHARILARYFMDRGLKVKIVWIKAHHTLAYVLSRVLAKLSPRSVVLNPHGTIIRVDAMDSGSINRLIWSWIEFTSILPWIIFRVYLPLLMGRVVIAERYLVDSIVAIAYSLNDPNLTSSYIAKTMLRLIPKKSVLIYLDSDYEEIERRRGIMADPEDVIDFQRSMYDKLSRCLGAFKINTAQQGIEDTARIIRSYLT